LNTGQVYPSTELRYHRCPLEVLFLSKRRHLRPGVLAALVLASALAGAPARAQPVAPTASAAELAAARQLFGEALRAEDEGRWREALDTFQRVAKVTLSPALRYHVGLCHEHVGELVEALNAFELAMAEGEEKRTPLVVTEARAHADAIRPRIARVVVRVPADATGVVITIDGRPINAALAGTSMPIDPGARRVTVRAANHALTFEASIALQPGESRQLDAVLGEKAAPAPAPTAVAAPPPPPPVAPPAPRPEAPAPRRNLGPVLAVGGVTAVLTIGAVAAGIAAHVDYTQYLGENVTPPTASFQQRSELRREGITKAWVSTGLTLGAVAAGAATIYLLVRHSSEPAPHPAGAARALAWSPWVGTDGAGLGLRGAL
jgi:hypothetical protein